MTGYVTDIQRFSPEDGPGIKTRGGLKGSNMKCAWRHNPETVNINPRLVYYGDKFMREESPYFVVIFRKKDPPLLSEMAFGPGIRQVFRHNCQSGAICRKLLFTTKVLLLFRKCAICTKK